MSGIIVLFFLLYCASPLIRLLTGCLKLHTDKTLGSNKVILYYSCFSIKEADIDSSHDKSILKQNRFNSSKIIFFLRAVLGAEDALILRDVASFHNKSFVSFYLVAQKCHLTRVQSFHHHFISKILLIASRTHLHSSSSSSEVISQFSLSCRWRDTALETKANRDLTWNQGVCQISHDINICFIRYQILCNTK